MLWINPTVNYPLGAWHVVISAPFTTGITQATEKIGNIARNEQTDREIYFIANCWCEEFNVDVKPLTLK